jgi:hypothetical protein
MHEHPQPPDALPHEEKQEPTLPRGHVIGSVEQQSDVTQGWNAGSHVIFSLRPGGGVSEQRMKSGGVQH